MPNSKLLRVHVIQAVKEMPEVLLFTNKTARKT